jgi:hypothetical protein
MMVVRPLRPSSVSSVDETGLASVSTRYSPSRGSAASHGDQHMIFHHPFAALLARSTGM